MTDALPKPPRNRAPARALVFAASLPHLQSVAHLHGYALAVHGSMATDLDLIAAPWVEDAAEPEALIEALRAAIDGTIRPEELHYKNPAHRPHGRLAWAIYLEAHCTGPYLDVSVMPRAARLPGED